MPWRKETKLSEALLRLKSMLKILRIAPLVSFIAIGVLAQESQKPSLAETLTWMRDFLHDHPGFEIKDELDTSECDAKVKETYVYTGFYPPEHIKTREETVSLGDLDPNTIRYQLVSPSRLTHGSGGYIVTIDSTNNQSVVQVEFFDSKGQSKRKASVKSFGVYLTDSISGQRFGAALKHAVVLCGGKVSPF